MFKLQSSYTYLGFIYVMWNTFICRHTSHMDRTCSVSQCSTCTDARMLPDFSVGLLLLRHHILHANVSKCFSKIRLNLGKLENTIPLRAVIWSGAV